MLPTTSLRSGVFMAVMWQCRRRKLCAQFICSSLAKWAKAKCLLQQISNSSPQTTCVCSSLSRAVNCDTLKHRTPSRETIMKHRKHLYCCPTVFPVRHLSCKTSATTWDEHSSVCSMSGLFVFILVLISFIQYFVSGQFQICIKLFKIHHWAFVLWICVIMWKQAPYGGRQTTVTTMM